MVILIAAAAGLAMPSALPTASAQEYVAVVGDPAARAIRAAVLAGPQDGVADFYRRRGFEPLWTEGSRLAPEVDALVQAMRDADDRQERALVADRAVALSRILRQASSRQPSDLARADVAMSRAFSAWVADRHRPTANSEIIFADPALAPMNDPAHVLQTVATAPSLTQGVAAATRMNPIFDSLQGALRRARTTGDVDAVALLQDNLERARALPADLGRRYIWVNVPEQMLELWEDGRRVDRMPVVVGKPSEPTPAMAGIIRYLVLNPYWHMPPDLAAARIAPAVISDGPDVLRRQQFDVVADFSDDAQVLEPAGVDWEAVAAGTQKVFLRQRPGPRNMMGAVKFAFPNDRGVYLHDTPLRALFASGTRADSAGCVRLSDARRLARALVGDDYAATLGEAPEQRVDLPQPIPVYLVYFTALPDGGKVVRLRDIYDRDRPRPHLSQTRAALAPKRPAVTATT